MASSSLSRHMICRGARLTTQVNTTPMTNATVRPMAVMGTMGFFSPLPQYCDASTTTPSPAEVTIICRRNCT